MKSYQGLCTMSNFQDRLNYLKMYDKVVGEQTFGLERYLNQKFYTSSEWLTFRRAVIIRDNCCDLGIDGYNIDKYPIIHHINSLTRDDIINVSDNLLDFNNVITVSRETHNLIHYGTDLTMLSNAFTNNRTPNDTRLW